VQSGVFEPDEVQREDGKFDIERFKAAVRIYITSAGNLVDNASYPTKDIAEIRISSARSAWLCESRITLP